jgi:ABC-type microcin C transport system duplicated ATPase subunit YejF
MVMQQGIARECADTDAVFYDSHDEYTRQLIKSVPRIQSESDAAPKEGSVGETVLSVDSVAVEFSMSGDGWLSAPSVLRAVDDVSLTVKAARHWVLWGNPGVASPHWQER